MAKATAGLILFAHGARDAEWADPFRDIAARVAECRADLSVELAFLEFQTPGLADAVATLFNRGHRAIHVAPLFMAQGGHLKQAVPRLLDNLQERYPELQLELLSAIGDVDDLRAAIATWLTNTVPASAREMS